MGSNHLKKLNYNKKIESNGNSNNLFIIVNPGVLPLFFGVFGWKIKRGKYTVPAEQKISRTKKKRERKTGLIFVIHKLYGYIETQDNLLIIHMFWGDTCDLIK